MLFIIRVVCQNDTSQLLKKCFEEFQNNVIRHVCLEKLFFCSKSKADIEI